MAAPDDIRFGAVAHDPGCHACIHRWHLMPCDLCACTDHTTPGLD